MKTFAQMFRDVYTPELEAMGFKRKRNIFHKLVNDKVVLALSFNQYSSGRVFTIQFEFWPLCDGDDMDVFMDSNYVLHRIVPELRGRDEWSCEIEKCEEELQKSLEYCRKTVFPYFNSITDYQSYYECCYQLDNIEEYMKNGFKEIPNLCLVPYHYTYLALGQYELALKAKEAEIKQNKWAMDSYIERRGIKLHEHPRYPRYVKKLEYYEKLKNLIENNDHDAIKQIITQNEEYSRKSYERNFLGIKSK